MFKTDGFYRWLLFPGFSVLLFLAACGPADKEADIDAGAIYFDYKIVAEDGMDNLTVLLQFRQESEDGLAITLPGNFSVMLDNEEIPADSSGFTGTFYEIHKPIEAFLGKHNILFTGDNEEFAEEFQFEPMLLETEIPEAVKRGDLILSLLGRNDGDLVRVVLTDTSLGDGLNKVDTLRGGQLLIPAAELQKLTSGPVQLELTSETELPLSSAPDMGRLSIIYTLTRQFNLED